MRLEQARTIAERYRRKLQPFCEKIEIAGSIRRERPTVKDIELVCIPKTFKPVVKTLFGDEAPQPARPIKEFCDLVNEWEAVKGSPAGKYTQRVLIEGIKLDLFMTTRDNWGLIFMIRTGSADYSKKMLGIIKTAGFKSDGGQLVDTDTGEIIPVKTEKEFYQVTGSFFEEPKFRQ